MVPANRLPRVTAITIVATMLALASLGLSTRTAGTAESLVIRPSPYDVARTVDRLEAAVKARGAAVVAKVDHAAAAQANGLSLRPTVLVLFGNPKLGTPLMQSRQTAGIDLPLHVLVWQEADGTTRIGYTSAGVIASRHSITDRPDVVDRVAGVLAAIVDEVATP